MSKRNIIRVDDYVRIINPEIVLRTGYSLTKQIVKDTLITQEQKDSIRSMVYKFAGRDTIPENNGFDTYIDSYHYYDNSYEKILDELAYVILRSKCFGGDERKLYTETREDLRGKEYRVHRRKVVKTGIHKSGYESHNYFDDVDYEPPCLMNEKTHVLFMVNFIDDIWIENKNLEKIKL